MTAHRDIKIQLARAGAVLFVVGAVFAAYTGLQNSKPDPVRARAGFTSVEAQPTKVEQKNLTLESRGVFIYANNEALFYPLEVLRGEVLDGELQGVAFRIDPTAPEANMVSFTGSQKLPYELLPYSEAVFQFPEVRVYEAQ